MALSDRLRREADTVWKALVNHPFVVELYKGTLPREKFVFYVLQDYNYLIGMMRALSIAAARSRYEVARELLELAYLEATTEMKNYEKLLRKLGLSISDAIRTEPSPTNVAYVNFLLVTALMGSPCESLASFLPCFWSYEEIAEHHREELEKNPSEIYRSWGSVYLSDEYREIVRRLRRLVDEECSSEDFDRLRRVFIMGSRYEYMFWDMAYRRETWPV